MSGLGGAFIKVWLILSLTGIGAVWPILLGGRVHWTVGLVATLISMSSIIAADTFAFLGGKVFLAETWSLYKFFWLVTILPSVDSYNSFPQVYLLYIWRSLSDTHEKLPCQSSYREFSELCHRRSWNGRWTLTSVIICSLVKGKINNEPFKTMLLMCFLKVMMIRSLREIILEVLFLNYF